MELQTEPGFRLGWNPLAVDYVALVGTPDWAIELKRGEFVSFRRLALELGGTMAMMADSLMDGEMLSCELDCDDLWMEVEGYSNDYALRFILHHGRRCEGEWPSAVAFVAALAELELGL